MKKHQKVAYTRNQLQPVENDEEAPPAEKVFQGRPPPNQYIVEKIIGKRLKDRRIEYKVKWKGYPLSEATWEPVNQLPKKVVEAYELTQLI